jgi:hypothetical protein
MDSLLIVRSRLFALGGSIHLILTSGPYAQTISAFAYRINPLGVPPA